MTKHGEKKMKKAILIICAMVAIGFTTTSCNKTRSCSCKHYYQGEYYQTTEWDDVTVSCSELARDIENGGNTMVSCSQI